MSQKVSQIQVFYMGFVILMLRQSHQGKLVGQGQQLVFILQGTKGPLTPYFSKKPIVQSLVDHEHFHKCNNIDVAF